MTGERDKTGGNQAPHKETDREKFTRRMSRIYAIIDGKATVEEVLREFRNEGIREWQNGYEV